MISILLICGLLITFNTDKAGSNRSGQSELWQPDNTSRDMWLRCHGFSCEEWERTRRKMYELQMEVAGPGFTSYAMNPTHEAETLDQCIWLTEHQIDMILNNMDETRTRTLGHREKRKTGFNTGLARMWPTEIHFKFDGMHSASEKEFIRGAFHHWEEQTCLRFTELPTERMFLDHHILVTRQPTGCHSFVGKIHIIPQQLNLAGLCLRKFGVPVHEIGHALGLFHEQQRSDRDQYVRVLWDNLGFYAGQFYQHRTDDLVPYDYSSVMHYGPYAGSRNGAATMVTLDPLYQQTMGQRNGLSFLDAKLINQLYCSNACDQTLPRPCQHGGYQDPKNCAVCKCPDGLGGPFCDDVAKASNADCGGRVQLSADSAPIYLESPGYHVPGYYSGFQGCTWWIQGQRGLSINLEFQGEFGVFCGIQRECLHWVELMIDTDIGVQGPRFCCDERPADIFSSMGRDMLVVFRSNVSQPDKRRQRGFKALVWAGRPGIRPMIAPTTTTTPKPTTTASTTTATPKCLGMDLIILLDTDDKKHEAKDQLNLVADLVKTITRVPIEVKVGLVTFGRHATTELSLVTFSSVQGTIQAIHELTLPPPRGTTDVFAGLHEMIEEFSRHARPDTRHVAVMVTDGGDVDSFRSIVEAQRANQEGVELYIVGVGPRFLLGDALYMITNRMHVTQLQSYMDVMIPPNFIDIIRGQECRQKKAWTCSFEDESDPLCGMEQSLTDHFDWTRHSGLTPSTPTGPASAQDGQYYIYIEATHRKPNDQAIIYFPQWDPQMAICVSFYYNMFGFHIRRLELVKISSDSSLESIWQKVGQIDESWHFASMQVSIDSGERLALVGTRGQEYSGDIAVDNIHVEFEKCM